MTLKHSIHCTSPRPSLETPSASPYRPLPIHRCCTICAPANLLPTTAHLRRSSTTPTSPRLRSPTRPRPSARSRKHPLPPPAQDRLVPPTHPFTGIPSGRCYSLALMGMTPTPRPYAAAAPHAPPSTRRRCRRRRRAHDRSDHGCNDSHVFAPGRPHPSATLHSLLTLLWRRRAHAPLPRRHLHRRRLAPASKPSPFRRVWRCSKLACTPWSRMSSTARDARWMSMTRWADHLSARRPLGGRSAGD